LHVIGCSPDEVSQKIDLLLRFCACEGISPEIVLEQCREAAERVERREFWFGRARDPQTYRVLQSFLIHNGVNTFGEIVCMPTSKETVATEQGTQWEPGRAAGVKNRTPTRE
jgi:hypothetical protein